MLAATACWVLGAHAPDQRAAATALAVEPPAAASLGQTATPETRKQIARWIYEDKIEQQQSGRCEDQERKTKTNRCRVHSVSLVVRVPGVHPLQRG